MDRYSVTIAWSDRDKAFVASVPEFPNLYAFGATKAEALAQEEDALAAYAELHKEKGVPLPMPEKRPAFSGQLRLRMPKTLHARLSSLAKVGPMCRQQCGLPTRFLFGRRLHCPAAQREAGWRLQATFGREVGTKPQW